MITVLQWNIGHGTNGQKRTYCVRTLLDALVLKYEPQIIIINENIHTARRKKPRICFISKSTAPAGYDSLDSGIMGNEDSTTILFNTGGKASDCSCMKNMAEVRCLCLPVQCNGGVMNFYAIHADTKVSYESKRELLASFGLSFVALGDWNRGIEYRNFSPGKCQYFGDLSNIDHSHKNTKKTAMSIGYNAVRKEIVFNPISAFPDYTRNVKGESLGWTDYYVSNIGFGRIKLIHHVFDDTLLSAQLGGMSKDKPPADHLPVVVQII